MATTLSGDYTLPDAELFKTRFPAFGSVSDSMITMIIDESEDHVDDRWRSKDYQPAIMYLVAHLLTLEGEPARSDALSASAGNPVVTGGDGPVSKTKVGDVETWFDTDRSGKGVVDSNSLQGADQDRLNFSLTHFGRQFMRLRQKNHGGPRVFVPS